MAGLMENGKPSTNTGNLSRENKRMITIEVHGHKLALSFTHEPITDHPKIQRLTTCRLINLDNGKELAQNEAACSKKDNFDRAKGRKLALARVLCQHDFGFGKPSDHDRCSKCGSSPVPFVTLSKQARTIIWVAYFDAVASKFPEPKPEAKVEASTGTA